MNRAKRVCAYRDCNVNSHSDPERTLFQFPKDEERANKWRMAGIVDPIDSGQQFMCDKHFSRIYICFSSRRKMLLNTAIPRPYGTDENDDADLDQVQSSSIDVDEITIEEHLDESLMDDGEGILTEIIYMDHIKDEDEPVENIHKRKAPKPLETPSIKLTKIEKLPTSGTSTVVSSSTSTNKILNSPPKGLTPPSGTILRKIKLKKRPTIVPFNACMESTVQNVKKPVIPTVRVTEEPAETTVSSSPKKKLAVLKLLPSKSPTTSGSTSASTSNTKTVEEHQQSSSSDLKKEDAKATEEKNESVYEFIFKGEEYIQMPKAMYHEQRKDLQNRLSQSQEKVSALQKKLDYYRHMVKDLKEFLDALEEEKVEDIGR